MGEFTVDTKVNTDTIILLSIGLACAGLIVVLALMIARPAKK